MSSTVFVTGANGFIAQNLVSKLLEKGHKVIGQVRSGEKGTQLSKIVNNENFSYVVVPVIEAKNAFDKPLKDHPEVETFYHTASPVRFSDEDVENQTLIPAINGTKYVLQSIKDYAPQLKHFVYTSSAGALVDFNNLSIVNEESWSPITYEQAKGSGVGAYVGSKKFAEQEVWKFRDEYKPKFSVVTVLPSFVLGPNAYVADLKNLTSTGATFSKYINAKTREELEEMLQFPSGVDIRDVVNAHVFAAENELANGKRLVCHSGTYNADLVLTILNEKFPGKTNLKPSEQSSSQVPDVIDNKATKALLGEFISIEQSITDAIDQLVKNGVF